jgi:hypothetical protein
MELLLSQLEAKEIASPFCDEPCDLAEVIITIQDGIE